MASNTMGLPLARRQAHFANHRPLACHLHVTVLRGAHLGEGVEVAPGSLVYGPAPAGAYVSGDRSIAHESPPGTFRTWRDVRLESAMRNKADIRQRYGCMSSRPRSPTSRYVDNPGEAKSRVQRRSVINDHVRCHFEKSETSNSRC